MKTLAYCFSCNKEHDITKIGVEEKGLKCDCGGFIISPSGKIQSKLAPENDEDKRLLGQYVMLKIYQIYYYDECGWCTENPQNFDGEIETFNQEEGWNIDIQETIDKISKLNIGEEFKIEGLTFKCFEMWEEDYKNLHEFSGW